MAVRVPKPLVEKYARMWPREVFDYVIARKKKQAVYLAKRLPILQQPGVYILYRDDVPYYVGKAGGWLWTRLFSHARVPGGRYNNFWNYFSVFVIHDKAQRDAVESILIAAFPTANSAKPKIRRERLPDDVLVMWRQKRDFDKQPYQTETERSSEEDDE
ncbi:MAG: GIY-YIG nuclease family protein [Acidobacteriota bacterium]